MEENVIEQAACEYAETVVGIMHRATAKNDFKAGARFVADKLRWISVEEELPPLGETVLAKKEGKWLTLAMYCDLSEHDRSKPEYAWIAGNSVKSWDVTHWRRIV